MIEMGLAFAAMLVGHYCADRVLQPSYLSEHKRHQDIRVRWRALGLHGAAHGFFVAVVTGSAVLAVAELVTHAAIDRGKGRGWYGLKVDQGLHVACKAAWAAALGLWL